jgi:hypothetical protein
LDVQPAFELNGSAKLTYLSVTVYDSRDGVSEHAASPEVLEVTVKTVLYVIISTPNIWIEQKLHLCRCPYATRSHMHTGPLVITTPPDSD